MKKASIVAVMLALLVGGCTDEEASLQNEPSPQNPQNEPSPQATNSASTLVLIPITRGGAGLQDIPYFSAGVMQVDKRLEELAAQPNAYTPDDYRAGITRAGDSFIAGSRFKETIAGNIRIGSSIAQVTEALGEPSIDSGDVSFYKTDRFYLGISGEQVVEEAIIAATPAGGYKENLLAEILKDLIAGQDMDLKDLLSQATGPSWASFFDAVRPIGLESDGWIAESPLGITISETDNRYIEVHNNFRGALYRAAYDTRNSAGTEHSDANDLSHESSRAAPVKRHFIQFREFDSVAGQLEEVVSNYRMVDAEFSKAAQYAPGGKQASMDLFSQELQESFLIIRTLDSSVPDYRIRRPISEYVWLTDDYILYTTNFPEQKPMVLDARPDRKNKEDIDVLQAAGLSSTDDGIYIDRVERGQIHLKLAGSNKPFAISFQEDGNGGLQFTKVD